MWHWPFLSGRIAWPPAPRRASIPAHWLLKSGHLFTAFLEPWPAAACPLAADSPAGPLCTPTARRRGGAGRTGWGVVGDARHARGGAERGGEWEERQSPQLSDGGSPAGPREQVSLVHERGPPRRTPTPCAPARSCPTRRATPPPGAWELRDRGSPSSGRSCAGFSVTPLGDAPAALFRGVGSGCAPLDGRGRERRLPATLAAAKRTVSGLRDRDSGRCPRRGVRGLDARRPWHGSPDVRVGAPGLERALAPTALFGVVWRRKCCARAPIS